jgi:FMN phosphatase YigB (HAD superfamily)
MHQTRQHDVERLTQYLTTSKRVTLRGLGERVQRAMIEGEAARLVDRMEALNAGELDWLTFDEAWKILSQVRRSTNVREFTCAVRCDVLNKVDPAMASSVARSLAEFAEGAPRRMKGSLFLHYASELALLADGEFLALSTTASTSGWSVLVGHGTAEAPALQVRLHSTSDEVVTLETRDDTAQCLIRLAAGPAGPALHFGGPESDLEPLTTVAATTSAAGETGRQEIGLSVADLFGDRISLRDLEPRAPSMKGLGSLRGDLGWDHVYVPRKNEPQYGRVLVEIMRQLDPAGPRQVVFIGDTLLNDGGAIRGLQAAGPQDEVWGFLCGATSGRHKEDVVLGQIYFGARWASLPAFLHHAIGEGLRLGSGTFVLFDLDQTVYAAKRRDDAPLHTARWEATRDYLQSIIPAYRFDPDRAEAMYREFDRDAYHPVTRDNLDYVVLLILAAASGLADPVEIRTYAESSQPTIGALAEELRRRASMRVGHEEIDRVLEAIKAIYYNTMAGDQTPCKDFRRFECLAMAKHMADRGADRIVLNQEVVDLVSYLSTTEVTLMAFSDRPPEAAYVDGADVGDKESSVDLMTIPMAAGGLPIAHLLKALPR